MTAQESYNCVVWPRCWCCCSPKCRTECCLSLYLFFRNKSKGYHFGGGGNSGKATYDCGCLCDWETTKGEEKVGSGLLHGICFSKLVTTKLEPCFVNHLPTRPNLCGFLVRSHLVRLFNSCRIWGEKKFHTSSILYPSLLQCIHLPSSSIHWDLTWQIQDCFSDKREHETEEFHEQPEVKIYFYLKDRKQTLQLYFPSGYFCLYFRWPLPVSH